MKIFPISANFGPKSKMFEILIFYPRQVRMVKEPDHATVSLRNLQTSATDIFPIRHSTATAKRSASLFLIPRQQLLRQSDAYKNSRNGEYCTMVPKRHFNECQPSHGFIVTSLTFTTR
jgi:hypothetical protein